MAECLFYRLLVNVDDFGRLDARPAVIRAKCFPLKDTISNKDTENLLTELHGVGLISLYKVDGCVYLQMNKWDNAPRAKESKCPACSDDCIQVYTDVNTPRTDLPVTVTVTVTETVNREPELKPQQETGTVSAAKKRSDPKPAETEIQTACKETWKLYSDAYFVRYGVEPVRNKQINSQVKSFVDRLGFADSPHVAASYVSSNLGYYVQRGHTFGCLLADAEKLRTEWATNRSMTATRARQIDISEANFSAVGEAMKILEAQDHAEAA